MQSQLDVPDSDSNFYLINSNVVLKIVTQSTQWHNTLCIKRNKLFIYIGKKDRRSHSRQFVINICALNRQNSELDQCNQNLF